ncbi:MAG: hypothetical protein U5K71_03625 [Gracilimonas sp.]|nr:hypothetical protein [Gracilimonas sp.]
MVEEGNSDIVRDAAVMGRMINPTGTIISAGAVMMSSNNPLYEGESVGGENPLYEGQANDGDSDNNNNNEDPAPVQRYDMQPSSYCVAPEIRGESSGITGCTSA